MSASEWTTDPQVLANCLESLDMGVFTLDTGLRYTHFNQRHAMAMQSVFGVEIKPGMGYASCLADPEDEVAIRGALERVLAGERVQVPAFRSTSAWRWDIACHPMRDEAGQVCGLAATHGVGVFRRVVHDDPCEALFEQVDVSLAMVDAVSGQFLQVNPAFCTLLGHSKETLLARCFQDITHAEDRGLPLSAHRSIEKLLAHRDGSMLWTDVLVSGIKGTHGGIERHLLVIRDRTSEKVFQAELEGSQRMLDALMAHAPALIYMVDLQGHILRLNRRLEDVLGQSGLDVVGKTRSAFLPQELAEAHESNDQLVAITGKAHVFEEINHERDGAHTYLSVKFPVLGAEGHPIAICGISTDITGRKQVEQQMRENEQKHHDLLAKLKIGIVVSSLDQSVQYINQEGLRILDLTPGQAEGGVSLASACGFVSESGSPLPEREQPVCKAMASGQPVLDDMIGVRRPASGDIVWCLVNAFPETDGNGALQNILVTFVDITERKRMGDTLRAQERWIRRVIDQAPFGVHHYALGEEGRLELVAANAAAERILGVTQDRCLDQCIEEAFPVLARQGVADQIRELARNGGHGDLVALDGVGSDVSVVYEIHAFQTDPGRVTLFFSDTTARHRLEEELKESHAIFHHFMEHSPIYVFFKDADIRSLRLSRNYETMLHRPLSELLGRTMDDLFPSEFARKMIADDQEILNGGRMVTLEETFEGHCYTTIKFPIILEGVPRYLAGFTIDTTEQKNAERAIHTQIQELQRWHDVTLDRETRILELKAEVNGLLARFGEAPRYTSVIPEGGDTP